jgi:DMSO/TMAO reductase YedYZ molybdopterin-dependent catalytic subunit
VGTWTGVPVSVIAGMVQPTAEARYLRFYSFDSRYYIGWDLKSAMNPK